MPITDGTAVSASRALMLPAAPGGAARLLYLLLVLPRDLFSSAVDITLKGAASGGGVGVSPSRQIRRTKIAVQRGPSYSSIFEDPGLEGLSPRGGGVLQGPILWFASSVSVQRGPERGPVLLGRSCAQRDHTISSWLGCTVPLHQSIISTWLYHGWNATYLYMEGFSCPWHLRRCLPRGWVSLIWRLCTAIAVGPQG